MDVPTNHNSTMKQRPIGPYAQAGEKGSWVTNDAITAQIYNQRRERSHPRKYGRRKATATRGLVNASLFPQVLYRPLSEYEPFAQGGGSWTN